MEPADRHTVPRQPGATRQDPAWNGRAFSCRHSAPGNGSTHVYGHYRLRQSRAQPPAVPTTPRGGATKRSVRIHPRAPRRRSRHRRHLPKSEIPIAIACGPRVPSSGTFVRLPAPETPGPDGQILAAAGQIAAVVQPLRIQGMGIASTRATLAKLEFVCRLIHCHRPS